VQVEAAVVFGAFYGFADDQAISQVGVAVRADAVGRIEPAFVVAHEGEGFFAVIEADDVLGAEVGGGTDFQPAFGIGPGFGGDEALFAPGFGRRQGDFDAVGGVFDLLEEGGDDFFPAGPEAGVGLGHVVFDQLCSLGRLW
jgi:hypothetical protein